MTPDLVALGRRAVACPGWRWLPGMLEMAGRRFVRDIDWGEAAWLEVAEDSCEWLLVDGHIPDLSDPATLGCLLALVREVLGDPAAYAHPDGTLGKPDGWWSLVAHHRCCGMGATEAEALVAALEAA